jgi:type IV secretory pathway VirB10-like protein
VRLDNVPAADLLSYTGLEDKVSFPAWRLLKAVALSTCSALVLSSAAAATGISCGPCVNPRKQPARAQEQRSSRAASMCIRR